LPSVDPRVGTLRAFSHSWGLAAQTTPRVEVWREGSLRLFRYGMAEGHSGPALLLLYAQINRPSILDLEPGRSLIEGLVAAGRDVYLLDWGDPQPEDHERTLAQLLQGPVHRAMKAISSRRKVDLLGICQGGVFALLYAAMYPNRVRRLVTMVTPVDFQTPDDLLSLWARACAPTALGAPQFSSGSALHLLFQMLAPFRQGVGKYLDLLGNLNDPAWVQRFRRMERWVHDCPDPPRTILRTFVEDLYRQNGLLRNTLRLDGQQIDLRKIRAPLLNIYGTEDHIVPPASSRALSGLSASRRYEEWALPVGHIGIFVSAKAAALPSRIALWLARR
jgi:polyhydroxyalkanoate synthase